MYLDKELQLRFLLALTFLIGIQSNLWAKNPKLKIETSLGEIEIELFKDKAPIGVKNFMSYVKDKYYAGTIFHRVIPGFMIQGGGFTPDLKKKDTKTPIKNEADNGLRNEAGTLAWARTNIVNSATSQFFINLVSNSYLNHRAKTPTGYGYAVFGKVTKGMPIVNKIAKVKTGAQKGYRDVPVNPVIIKSVKEIK
jgi:cyclophilin family peptidyl-prolyl cis-trans isomerase